jgi:hypothetical protein
MIKSNENIEECGICGNKYHKTNMPLHVVSCNKKAQKPKSKILFKKLRFSKQSIRIFGGIAAIFLLALISWFAFGNTDTKPEVAEQPEVAEVEPTIVVEVAEVAEPTVVVEEPEAVDPMRVPNKELDPAWAAYERPDKPIITEWKSVKTTLSKDGNPVSVVIYFPYVISENDITGWEKGEVFAKSYIGKNPVLTNVIVHPDAEGVQGEWILFEVAKNGPNGLIPLPGFPRFGNEEFTSTKKWTKIQEI